jgi:stearoyl-CoA desaturase (delta-9 desaturase)
MKSFRKVKLWAGLTNLVGITGLFLFFSWQGVCITLAVFFVMNIGMSAGFHRMVCHRAFEPKAFWWWPLMIAGTLAGVGSSISWVGLHRAHHTNSDIEGRDPYYPHNGIIKTWVFGPWSLEKPLVLIKDLIRDKRHSWLHKHYYELLYAYVLLLLLVDPVMVIWAWALPSAMMYSTMQISGVFGHLTGSQPHDNKDNSRDCHWLNLITFGESYQNTHHHSTKKVVMGKFDVTGYVIKYVLIK